MIKRDSFLAEHYVGELIRGNDGKLKWRLNNDKFPLRSYDKDNANREGCLEIFEMPSENANGEIANGRYIAGIDPIDNDYTVNGSLASIFVFDMWTDKIVAEYTARPVLAEEFYEICLRLTSYYNAEANYESNLKGLFTYFSNHNALHLLSDTPEILKDMYIAKTILHGNRAKGTRTTKEVIKLGKTLQRQWMMSQYEIELYDEENGDTQTTFIQNLRRIRSIGYIKECIAWNADINADRVSAMDMVMILREDRAKMIDKYEEKSNMHINSMTGDDFLDANWAKALGAMENQKQPWM